MRLKLRLALGKYSKYQTLQEGIERCKVIQETLLVTPITLLDKKHISNTHQSLYTRQMTIYTQPKTPITSSLSLSNATLCQNYHHRPNHHHNLVFSVGSAVVQVVLVVMAAVGADVIYWVCGFGYVLWHKYIGYGFVGGQILGSDNIILGNLLIRSIGLV